MTRRIFSTVGTAMLVSALVSCSLFRSGPGATVKQFYQDVEAGNITEALALLSSQLRGSIGDQKLRAGLATQATAMRQQHKGLRSIQTEKEDVQGELATVTTLITYTDGTTQRDVTKLVLEDGAWKISPSK